MKIIEAPWTLDQVRALNNWQVSLDFHPFTCGKRQLSPHRTSLGDAGVLIAQPQGWVCLDCDYTQTWAHAIMFEPPPPPPPDNLR